MGVRSYLPGTGRRVRVCAAALIAACALVLAAVLPGQALAAQGGGLSALQRYFASDPVSWAARHYLSYETMSIG